MRLFGMSEADIAHHEKEETREYTAARVFVWQENWLSVQVFTNCKWDRIAVGERLIPTGISSVELQASAALMGVKTCDLQRVVADVRLMEGVASPLITG